MWQGWPTYNYNVMSLYGGTVPLNRQQGVATTTVHHVRGHLQMHDWEEPDFLIPDQTTSK